MPDDSWGFGPGDEVAPGRVVETRLGGGDRFEAYTAWDETLHATVVAKLIRPGQTGRPRARRALAHEADILQRVQHPAVVRSFGAVLDGERPHLVLEHLEGPRLSTLVRRHGRLSVQQLLPLALQLSAALHYLDAIGLVHLDVKPANVIVGEQPRLIDFSIARTRQAAAGLAQPVGTRTFMAPEQCRPSDGTVTPAADVWGLGSVLYTGAAGHGPFPRKHPARYPQLEIEPPPLTGIPPALDRLIRSCLDRDGARRPSPSEVAAEAEDLLAAGRPRRIVLGRPRPRWS